MCSVLCKSVLFVFVVWGFLLPFHYIEAQHSISADLKMNMKEMLTKIMCSCVVIRQSKIKQSKCEQEIISNRNIGQNYYVL